MTSQSPRIYTYKITFEEVPYYYYGVHKEKKFDEYYVGSPVTHKWCWEFYTPKKQILEVFDYTDDGLILANKVEQRLIRPVFNTDKWCLNENCGGYMSLKQRIQNGKKAVEIQRKNKTGFFGQTKEQRIQNGKKAAETHKRNGTGVFGQTFEQKSEAGKKGGKIGGKIGGKVVYELGIGIHGMTFEEKSARSKINGLKHKENKTGICGQTKEQMRENGLKSSSQQWMCTETGYITSPGPLTIYQKNRNIDTSKRIRVS